MKRLGIVEADRGERVHRAEPNAESRGESRPA
jgi:hypothetical protein